MCNDPTEHYRGILATRDALNGQKTTVTQIVRQKLATDYGIRDIPAELLDWFVWRYSHKLATSSTNSCAASVALKIANEWQRGKSTPI